MRIAAICPTGENQAWSGLPEMADSIGALIASEKPDILASREWAAPLVEPVALLDAVADIPVPENSLLVLNGRARASEKAIGCISAVSYCQDGLRKTTYFPKRYDAYTTALFFGEVSFEIPDAEKLLWVNSAEDRHGDTPINPRLLEYSPGNRSLSKPAVLDLTLGDSEIAGWFPICYDSPTSPSPGPVSLVVRPSNQRDISTFHNVGERLCVNPDEGCLSLGLGGSYFLFTHYKDGERTRYSSELLMKRWDRKKRVWAQSGAFDEMGSVREPVPGVVVVELYRNPIAPEIGKP